MKKRLFVILPIILLLFIGIWGRNLYKQPLAPSPPQFGSIASPTPIPKASVLSVYSSKDQIDQLKNTDNEPDKRAPICGGPPEMYILATGVDSMGDIHQWGLSDIIMIARFDLINGDVSVLSIPRDLWVPMYGLEEYNVTEFRINSAYFYGNLYNYPGGGPIFLAKTIYDNLGIQVDHYLSINKTALVEIIDELGGVDITFPDKSAAGVNYLYRGTVHFSGEKALHYLENRIDSTWNRADRALYFVQAIKNQVLQPSTLTKLFGLMNSLRNGVVTDLSPEEISMLRCVASKIDLTHFQFYEIGPSMTEQTYIRDYWALLPKEDLIKEHVQRFLAGEPSEYTP
jgi:LCP family protein required for cell wall assembly